MFLLNLLKKTLAFRIESIEEWINSSGISCQCRNDLDEKEDVRQQCWVLSTQRLCFSNVAYFLVCVVNGNSYTVSCTLNFPVTVLQANVSFHIFRSMYHMTAVGKLKVKTVICLLDPETGAVTIRPPRSHIIRDQCFTRSLLLEACNSHNKPIQWYFLQTKC